MPDQEPAERPSARAQRPDSEPPESPRLPDYKGEPLDAGRGPGLGCFWAQVAVLSLLLVLTPLSVVWGAEPWISAALLIVVLVLLLLVGQTAIFLLRLVAADRRSQRRPLAPTARKTVGMLEEKEAAEPPADAPAGERDGPRPPA
ncbi:MAG TPA: hypothetical protein VMP67_00790 [Candidatus Limnocylindria bacterium]|nr:hypothetical protein [Candidatus Limnocylindria bacterium]